MRLISTILRIIANAFLFCIYALVAITIVNFIFWLIMVNAWKMVPGSEDPIHMALAIGTTWIMALITFILRKYFYISLWKKENIKKVEKVIIKEVIQEEKVIKSSKAENAFDEEMKIYIDKEIK
jgi:hypothetical protein